MKKLCSMRRALSDPNLLADALPGESWFSWRTLLIALCGEELLPDEREVFRQLTGRDAEPGTMIDVFLCVAGRRSGKSRAMSVLVVYLSCLCDWSDVLVLGERGLALFLAPSERQAKTVHRYATAVIEHTPLLASTIVSKTAEVISLNNNVDLEIQAASWRRARGGTAIAVVLDESAYLHSAEDSGNRDEDIFQAVRPSLATTGGPCLLTSSPSQMDGIPEDDAAFAERLG